MTPRPSESSIPDLQGERALVAEGRFEEALDGIRRRLGPRPAREAAGTAAPLLRRIAREAEAGGHGPIAAQAMELAVSIAPTFADLRFHFAIVLLGLQRRAEARRELQKALEINPAYVAARVELALLDAREGLVGESLEALRSLARQTNVEEPGAFKRGLKSLQQADWDEAASLLRRALKLSDPILDGVLERFHAHMDAGEHLDAARVVRDVLPRFEGYPDLHFLLASAEFREGHLDDAIASFARALELNPDFHAARTELARALEALGEVAQARDQVGLVLERQPGHPQAAEMRDRWGEARRRPKSRDPGARKDP
jgi:tetratricopeptide (TPR) repeat protein